MCKLALCLTYLTSFIFVFTNVSLTKQRKDLTKLTFGVGPISIRDWLDIASHVCSSDYALCISLRIDKSLRERFPSGASLCKVSCYSPLIQG